MFMASFRWISLVVAGMVAAASPVAAQQVTPDNQAAPQQPTPPELAPPVLQNSADLPPPFPHYPVRAPREHDPNYHPGRHKVSRAQSPNGSKAAAHHAKARKTTATRGRAKASHRGKAKAHATRQYFSKRTIRQCHGMTYKQIMAHKNCRTMMQQELAAQPSHHTKSRKTNHSRKSAPARKSHHRRR